MEPKKKNSYFDYMHHIGRIGTFVSICFMFGIPLIVCTVYGVFPTFAAVAPPAITLISTYLLQTLSEVISYTPMVGTAAYLTFITGNVGSIKLPVALNAMDITDSSTGTEKGDAVSAIAVAVSSMITMVVVAVGVVLLVPLQPFLSLPSVKIATGNVLPALYGTLLIIFVTNGKVNGFRITNRWMTCLVPMAFVIAFSYLVYPIKGITGYALMCMLPLTCLIGIGLNKLGLVKMIPLENQKSSEDNKK